MQKNYMINGKMMEHFNFEDVNSDSLYKIINDHKIGFESISKKLSDTKISDKYLFDSIIERIKILYINSDDYDFLLRASWIFHDYKIHSAAPLIVAKLLSGNYDDKGGTFLYCLFPLRKKLIKDELKILWHRNISWEMEQKLELMGVVPDDQCEEVIS